MRVIRLEDMTPDDWANLAEGELTSEELADVYRQSRETFTAADLQEYTELDEGIPSEQVLAEFDEIVKQSNQKQP